MKKKDNTMAMPLEDMVSILLSLEFNASFHIEALKALAVAIRTNIARSGNKYIEINKESNLERSDFIKKVNRAVRETEGIVITYNGNLIDAKYHLACGGSTENSENVTGNPVLYLRRVLCKYCKNSPYWQNEKSLSIEEIQRLIKKKFPHYTMKDVEIVGLMEDIKRDAYGRVKYLKIGNEIISGQELMELLNLDSTRFIIFPTGVKFISRGKGHGIGLCLYGANKMAEEGHSFEEIIKYYYTGVEIERNRLPTVAKPLNGKTIVIDPGHGGEDLGFKGDFLGLLEKDIVFNISLKLKEGLEALGASVYLTREGDDKILTTERIDKVNKINPHFFISIHMDYYANSTRRGVEMFHFRNDEESRKIGLLIEKHLKEMNIPTRGVKEGNFYVFRGIGASALMVEAGFLSNKDEEIKFKDEKYMNNLALCLSRGIVDYFTK
ncbi:MAG: N-acetylmuramoyl-L-alanine amidase [Tissierellia bacterium]|nr:N-acetylmuramoyl-L-alanine amidase [Tissierellia bacterium]